MNTHETYVSLETAKLLKKAGFDWGCFFYYENKKLRGNYKDSPNNMNASNIWQEERYCSAPTLEVVQKWLREVKAMHICVKPNEASANCKYFVTVIVNDTKWGNLQDDNRKTIMFDTYEEAQEAGIKKALEIILEKGE